MIDTNKIFPRWLQELKRFQALKSEFFLYGNVYDCYSFPVNYTNTEDASALEYAKFNDIRKLLKQYLFSRGFEVFSYFDVIDGLQVESPDNSITVENISSVLQFTN